MRPVNGGARPARQARVSAEMWSTLFGLAYLVMMTNLMLIVGTLPLLALLITTDPRRSWPALALAAVIAAPALTAAFSVFHAHQVERSSQVAIQFWRGWRRHLWRSLAAGAVVVAGAVMIGADLVFLAGSAAGAILSPVLVITFVVMVVTALLVLVAGVERPDARLRDVIKASAYLGVRRWHLTLFTLGVLLALGLLLTVSPAIALGVAAAPLLYAVWGNCRYTLRPVLHPVAAVS
ncbi:DUF624 domain-containing protein [Microbacterium sp. H1-D42]|uniref:DUF624 domain-containing protein n=1 Tax=Microbacterium sp. H1-D42 TaxID=2925844 RepID=UPI001F53C198|nr:DUF624 domain-containing protein [Microbacterium sp. H1-D42]UNK72252.1 DUF624 domain-containing protein [Microbacterium sp. H1-D42]